jgi:hypothetical protein
MITAEVWRVTRLAVDPAAIIHTRDAAADSFWQVDVGTASWWR